MIVVAMGDGHRIDFLIGNQFVEREAGVTFPFGMSARVHEQAMAFHFHEPGAGSNRGVRIYFTAPSTSACSWELSTDPNLYRSPIAVSSQARNGRDGIAAWSDGTLVPGAAYWARVTCDGNQLEALVNGDRAYVITAP